MGIKEDRVFQNYINFNSFGDKIILETQFFFYQLEEQRQTGC